MIALALTMAVGGCIRATRTAPRRPSHEILGWKLNLADDVNELTSPVLLAGAHEWLDGGTAAVWLRGFNGKDFVVCVSRELTLDGGGPLDHRLFAGATAPRDAAARLVDMGSVEEAKIKQLFDEGFENLVKQPGSTQPPVAPMTMDYAGYAKTRLEYVIARSKRSP
jgi:hypothetical protein